MAHSPIKPPKSYFKQLVKYENCVQHVKSRGRVRNPWAVCHKSVGGETISELKSSIEGGQVASVMVPNLTRAQFNEGLAWVFKKPASSPEFINYWNQYLGSAPSPKLSPINYVNGTIPNPKFPSTKLSLSTQQVNPGKLTLNVPQKPLVLKL